MATRPASPIVLNPKLFLPAWNSALRCAPSKSPKPIITGALLDLDSAGDARLVATDFDCRMTVRVRGVKCDDIARVWLPRREFGEILRVNAKSETLIIGDPARRGLLGEEDFDSSPYLSVRSASADWSIPSEDADFFPSASGTEIPGFWFGLPAPEFVRLLSQTTFCTDPDSMRYAFGGVLLEYSHEEKTLALVATDGSRLSRATAEPEREDGYAERKGSYSPVLSVKALGLVKSLLLASEGWENETVRVGLDTSKARFATGGGEILARLVEGRFPRYQEVFPKSPHVNWVEFNRETGERFREAVSLASIATTREFNSLHLVKEETRLRVFAVSAFVGQAEAECQAPSTLGDNPGFSCRSEFLLAGIGAVEEGKDWSLSWGAPNEPVLIESDRFTHVLMPITREPEFSIIPRGGRLAPTETPAESSENVVEAPAPSSAGNHPAAASDPQIESQAVEGGDRKCPACGGDLGLPNPKRKTHAGGPCHLTPGAGYARRRKAKAGAAS